jgi:GntR family transcriptional regulator
MEREPTIPYYIQIAETIRRRIVRNYYGDGNLIPPTPELEKEFHVSNITIRKAFDLLRQEGLIQRKRGIGTTVRKPEPAMLTFELNGSFQRLVDSIDRIPLKIEVLKIATTPCPQEVQDLLSIPPEKNVWRMEKVRKHMDVPISYYIHYCDPSYCNGVTKKDGERENFIKLIQRSSKVKLTKMEQRLKATVADMDLSNTLKVKFGAPLFFVENIYFNHQDKPIVLTQMYYRGDMCSYKAVVQLRNKK